MAHRYKVTKKCYFQGCIREPENAKRNIVSVDKKFTVENKPSYLELIDGSGNIVPTVAEPKADKPAKGKKPESDAV